MYKALYLSVISIVILVGFSFASKTHNKFFVEISATNLIDVISDSSVQHSSMMPGVSIGYRRANSALVSSSVGLQFIPGIDRTNLISSNESDGDAQSLTDVSDLYGISMLYSVCRKLGNFELGVHSTYHLEFSESDLIVGMRMAYVHGFKGFSVGINCFYGYADIINFLDKFSINGDAVDMNMFVYNFGLTIHAPMEEVSPID